MQTASHKCLRLCQTSDEVQSLSDRPHHMDIGACIQPTERLCKLLLHREIRNSMSVVVEADLLCSVSESRDTNGK